MPMQDYGSAAAAKAARRAGMTGYGVPYPTAGWGVPYPTAGWGVPYPTAGYAATPSQKTQLTGAGVPSARYPLPEGYSDNYYDPELGQLYELLTNMGFSWNEARMAREENARQFDEDLQFRKWSLEQEMAVAREKIASDEGMQKYDWQMRFKELEKEHTNTVQLLQMDWRERQKLADKELGVQLEGIRSQERITAATIAAQPINWRVYEHWLAGQPAEAHPSGLPAAAPQWFTGQPTPGAAPGTSPYGAALAAGERVPEFQAYAGPSTAVGDIPWTAPHQMNLAQFSAAPLQFQERMYGAWRERGYMPETAQQQMYSAAPTGTAGGAVKYG